MLKDNYLEDCKKRYTIRAGELLGKNWNVNYLELAYNQFERKDLEKIIRAIKDSIKSNLKETLPLPNSEQNTEDEHNESINLATIVSTRKRHRSGFSYLKTNLKDFDKEDLEHTLTNLESRKYYPNHWTSNIEKIFEMVPHLFLIYKKIQNEILETALNKKRYDSDYQKNLIKFSTIFNLTEKESEIITFLFLMRVDQIIDAFFGNSNIDLFNLAKSTKYFCRFFDINPEELRKIFSKNSTLFKAGIIQRRRNDDIELSEKVIGFLGGYSNESLENVYVKRWDQTDTIKIEDHHVNEDKISILKNLLSIEKGCNILLYGHPGTGKTEFAKSLVLETGKNIFFLNQADEDGEENLNFRKQAIIAAQNIIDPKTSVMVIDECDNIINMRQGFLLFENDRSDDRKAWINDLLENTKHKIIWISNRVGGIDDSTKRRFSYTMEFYPLSYLQRKKVWEIQVAKQKINFLNSNDIDFLARENKVNSGGITLALMDVGQMKQIEGKEKKVEILTSILKQHKSFTESEESGLVKKTSKYNFEIINTNYPLDKIIEVSRGFFDNREKFTRSGIYNLNILLQGPPGTGKTEFVKHLAEISDKELMMKRVSDIKSKWYGESVKNIAASFKMAQKNNSILFFDEADSFFKSREDARDLHAEETNEFLTQMENFQGLLICATNFTDRLDQASMRRFNHKIKFDYLNIAGKRNLFFTYFSEIILNQPDEKVLERLDKLSGLTPGDFKVVYQKNVFNKREPIELLNELEDEVSYKKIFQKKVGLS